MQNISEDTPFIYHLLPNPMHGTTLYPLNDLKSIYPDVFEIQVKKYAHRMELMDTILPILNCKWNDVLHFSTLHPQRILNKLREIKPETKLSRNRFVKVPFDSVRHLPGVRFLRSPRASSYKALFDDCDIQNIASIKYQELEAVPRQTVQFWRETQKKGEPLLWFNYVPHILIKSHLDVSNFPFETFN